jgi:hypothetical protein
MGKSDFGTAGNSKKKQNEQSEMNGRNEKSRG